MSPAKKTTQKSTKAKTTTATSSGGFTADERAAMKARAQEQKAEARANKNRADGEATNTPGLSSPTESVVGWIEMSEPAVKICLRALASSVLTI